MRLVRLLSIGAVAITACVLAFPASSLAQAGTSDFSLSRSRVLSKEGSTNSGNARSRTGRRGQNSVFIESAPSLILPETIAVEEFVNYHKHRLPLPRAGQSVAMDVRWGGEAVSTRQPEAVLQIGFTTPEVSERADLRPLNLSLVIDKSGSMSAEDKMSRVKESLRAMIDQLNEDDFVSIVAFDTGAAVVFPSAPVGDGRRLRNVIDSLYPGGSTNLNAGLMLGYQEALKNYESGATNRVILLTDGIANVGEINPTEIARKSVEFNRRGIDLSTVGVGVELDQDLLRTLAKSGRGLFHFVSDAQDIKKVFVNEVQSLMSPVARRVELSVDYDADLQLDKIYGYSPRRRANGLTIPVDDMNNGLTQVVLMKFRHSDYLTDGRTANVKVRLSYYDIKQKRTVEETQEISLRTDGRRGSDAKLADLEVKKNYTIAELAQSLADMKPIAERGDYRRALAILTATTDRTYNRYPNMEDKDIRYVLDIVEQYQSNLRPFVNRRGD